MILKLKLLTDGSNPSLFDFKDFYVESDIITNFYIPETKEEEGDCVNIILDSYMMTFKQTPNLLKFLKEKFIDKL